MSDGGDAAALALLLLRGVVGVVVLAHGVNHVVGGGKITGTAGWFRVTDSNGAGVYDGSVSATGGGGDLQLSSTALATGISVDITSLTYTTPAG